MLAARQAHWVRALLFLALGGWPGDFPSTAVAVPMPPVYLPRGVADPEATTGYVQVADGTIAALALRTGALIWTAPVAARPLAVAGPMLVAQSVAEPSRLLVLDRAHGGALLRTTDPLPYPGWVEPAVASSERFAFQVEAVGSTLRYRWEAREEAGGAPLPRQSEGGAASVASGIAVVDLATGHLSVLPADRPLALPQLSLARPAGPAAEGGGRVAALLSAASEKWRVGNRAYRIQQHSAGEAQALSLAIFPRTGAEPRLIELATGFRLGVQVTADGRFLVVRSSQEAQGRSPAEPWEIFAVESARRLGAVSVGADIVDPCVVREVLYYVSHSSVASSSAASTEASSAPIVASGMRFLTLHAADFRRNRELWQRSLGQVVPQKTRALRP